MKTSFHEQLFKDHRFTFETIEVYRNNKYSIETEKIVDKLNYSYYYQVNKFDYDKEFKLDKNQVTEYKKFNDIESANEYFKKLLYETLYIQIEL